MKKSDKETLHIVTDCLMRAIAMALPQIQKQAGTSTMEFLKFSFPQGEFSDITIAARVRKTFWLKNPMIEFRVTGCRGAFIKNRVESMFSLGKAKSNVVEF